ncbi:MAG: MerR family transcriptional regulator [Pseudomonadota bacterium]
MVAPSKSAQAFRTIGELAKDLGLPQHILRYWETRFPQLRPLQRAGNRRYYRPEDVVLATRINQLLNHEGYTVKGVQKLLVGEREVVALGATSTTLGMSVQSPLIPALIAIRNRIAKALAEDDVAARI